jgi:hypothetical protein
VRTTVAVGDPRTLAVVSKVKPHYDWDEVQALLAGGDPPTPDDVSITSDGRRLDTAAAVIAFLEELQAERASEAAGHG